MKNNKLVFQVQYVVFSLAAILMMFLKFFNLKATIELLDSSTSHAMTGVDYIKLLKDPAEAVLGNLDILDVNVPAAGLRMTGIVLFAIPFVCMLLGIVVHLISMRSQKGSSAYAAFPGLALFLTVIELIVLNVLLKSKVSIDGIAVSIVPAVGCIIFMVIAFLLLLEDILILSKNADDSREYMEYPVQNYYGNENPVSYGNPEEVPQEDDITEYYRDKVSNRAVVMSEAVTVGKLTCIRGEYKGAEIVMRQGEMITLGRDQEICQLVFTDPHISRRHCIVIFQPDGTYSLTNLSKNGVKLHDGTDLPYNVPMTVPANTAFRLNEEVVFRVG